jgi:hypothetical protein
MSSPEVAGLFIISPLRGAPGAPPSEGMSLSSEEISATLEWNGFPAEAEESREEPLIRGKDIQIPSMTTATVPPMTYCAVFALLV